MNSTYIALIAKKETCSVPSNYRPISLTTSLYKLIAKVIAERLKLVQPDTISENQLAFVKGRHILDAILIANEAVNFWKQKKIKGFVVKLDIEKAFDKINWTFIDFMLLKKGFPQNWGQWISACITSVQYSILINGRPRGKIKPTRGIRQGDPISPFIFVLTMDYLSILNQLEKDNLIKGVSFNKKHNLTHLLFADDILLFMEDDDEIIDNMRFALRLFELASGLNINLNKSTISPTNIDLQRTNCVTSKWGFSINFLPIQYLGVPLGGKPISRHFWSEITGKFQRKINNWKYASLSRGDKVTLIKATLASIPNYHLSVFKPPKSVCNDIEKIWMNFLWRNTYEKKNINLIKWSSVRSPTSRGGLSINNVESTNFALLSKWIWRFFEEKNPLWKRIIIAKYEQTYLGELPTKSKYSSSKALWMSIIKSVGWVLPQIKWSIRRGDTLSFWHSKWHDLSPFSQTNPRLFPLSSRKENSIANMWNA